MQILVTPPLRFREPRVMTRKYTSLFCTALTLAQAQLEEDSHWFYDYGGPSPEPFAMERQGNYIYTGGLFLRTSGLTKGKNLIRFNLTNESWEQIPGLNAELNGSVRAIHAANDGMVYVGGNLSTPAGTSANRIARFDPSTDTWSALFDPNSSLIADGEGNGPSNGEVRAITQSGDFIYAGGSFTKSAWPTNERYIRRYQISTQQWQAVGNGLDGPVRSLLTLPDGSILAGGLFSDELSRWDGSSWTVYGGGVDGVDSNAVIIRSLAQHPDGRIFIGGFFDTAGSGSNEVSTKNIAAYDPATNTWNALAGGFANNYIQSNGTTFDSMGIYAITINSLGEVYAGGDIQADPARTNENLDHVALWDDTGVWKALGSGVGNTGSQIVNCLAIGLNQDLYVGGTFSEGWRNASSANTQFARWDGTIDFTDYIPGAAQNNSTVLSSTGTQITLDFLTRPGTDYNLESSNTLDFSSPTIERSFRGNGNVISSELTRSNEKAFYRFRATGP